MPRDSSGNFTRDNGLFQGGSTWAQTAATDPTIRSARHDTHDNDIGDEITNSLDRDGKGGMRSNLEMGGNRVVNVGAPVSDTDAIRRGDSFQLSQSALTGSVVEFTNIPSWAKQLELMFSGLRTDGTTIPTIQLGNAGYLTTDYAGTAVNFGPSTTLFANQLSTGFDLAASWLAANSSRGSATLSLIDPAQVNPDHLWVCKIMSAISQNTIAYQSTGSLFVNGGVQRIRISCGTDTFQSGTVGLLIKG